MTGDYNPPVDPFGTDRMTDVLKVFCREQGMSGPFATKDISPKPSSLVSSLMGYIWLRGIRAT